MIKAIIFDINGVLITSSTPSISEISAIRNDRLAFSKKLSDFKSGKITAKTFWDDFINGTRKKVRPLKDIMLLLEELKNNYRIFALSNSIRESTMEVLEEYGIRNYFDNVFTSFEIGYSKPDEEIFEYVLGQIRLKPEECLFIDDVKENTATARIMGFETLTISQPEKLRKAIISKGLLE
ncbi:MAG TPA: HAD-IA family hydrolase [Candidatus Nanoarchaeia archaeon]|nr:HAD-IA family hydrolase [Candidatus Nanoarchaeia archaeon]